MWVHLTSASFTITLLVRPIRWLIIQARTEIRANMSHQHFFDWVSIILPGILYLIWLHLLPQMIWPTNLLFILGKLTGVIFKLPHPGIFPLIDHCVTILLLQCGWLCRGIVTYVHHVGNVFLVTRVLLQNVRGRLLFTQRQICGSGGLR